MSQILIDNRLQIKKFDVFFQNKKMKAKSYFNLSTGNVLFLKEHSLFANKFFWIISWIGYFLWGLINIFITDGVLNNIKEPKDIKKIEIKYKEALSDEVLILLDKQYVQIHGLDVTEVLSDGRKLNRLETEENANENTPIKWVWPPTIAAIIEKYGKRGNFTDGGKEKAE